MNGSCNDSFIKNLLKIWLAIYLVRLLLASTTKFLILFNRYTMDTETLEFFNKARDERFQKLWLAAMNPKEFQRLMKFENCEQISVSATWYGLAIFIFTKIPSTKVPFLFLSDEITLRLNEVAKYLLAADPSLSIQNPIRSFLIASQLFVGLVYVHEQQVKFLYSKCFPRYASVRFHTKSEIYRSDGVFANTSNVDHCE